jgi:CDP-6-deoxy-D-xylo-4-hexulose-3-dehydrase|tara:strand:- start:165 stop:1358 length:1194 start_codon:yes stop_codon:yes gene_type:complete
MKKVYYAEANYSDEEIDAVIEVLKNNRLALMCGENVQKLEKKVANIFNKEFGLMTNSGSSANLIGVQALNLEKGSKVITPSLTFSTTVSPIVQSGLIPFFIDVEKETMQINTSLLKKLPLKDVSAICVPNLIGNVANWEEIYHFAKENNLKTIEDSADTIGYRYSTDINNWSDVSTTSFYASHVVTGAGFGGMTCFSDKENYDLGLSLRGWGRRSSLYGETEDYERRFNAKIDGINYDDKYIFDDIAYNFLPSEISAAFALVQIKNLRSNLKNRLDNYNYLKDNLSVSNNFFVPLSYENVETGWLAFPIILQNKLALKRKEVQIFLEKAGIQTRTIFTGNILRQPVAKKFKWESFGSFSVSDNIMESGILLGCHNRQTKDKMDYMLEKLFEVENCLK